MNLAKPDQHRSPAEAAALYNGARDFCGPELVSPDAFRARLVELNLCVTDSVGGWRSCPIHLDGDKAGHEVFFPPPAAIPAQLEKLRRFLVSGDNTPALFRAAVAKALILNCHPFTDGNGRVSRVLFNYILRQGGMPAQVYIPFYEIARRSHGGYEIALRQAEIRGEWEPFLRFMLAVVQCHQSIALAHKPPTRPSRLAVGGDG
jgi:Fic/DOC family